MKKISLLFMAVLTLGVTARAADGDQFTVDNLWYKVLSEENKTVSLTGTSIEKPEGKLIIPQIVANESTRYMVTEIGPIAFSKCIDLTSVTIPASVIEIGFEIFRDCPKLSEIIVAEGNTAYSSLDGVLFNKDKTTLIQSPQTKESFDIPNTVTEIGSTAFKDCTALKSITIPASVTTIKDYAFSNCSALTSVTIPASVTKIGRETFRKCSALTSVTIPASVTEIGQEAFLECSALTSFTIPASVTEIGSGLLSSCSSLEKITVAEENPYYSSLDGVLYNKKQSNLYQVPGAKKSYEFPNTVTRIFKGAFQGCHALKSINIPNSVTYISSYAFYGCTGLTSVTIPNSITQIESYAFYGCTGLTSVTIPNSVTKIENDAFSRCTGLTSVTIPNSVTKISHNTFQGCTGLTSVTIPNSVTKISYNTFYGCTGLTSVTIPNSVTEIGTNAFYGCTGLTSIYCYAANPPALGYWAFRDVNISNVILHVVKGAEKAYQEADIWKEFFITADLESAGIEDIEADGSNAPAEYFMLNGVRADGDALAPGLYIKRQGGKATKVLVR